MGDEVGDLASSETVNEVKIPQSSQPWLLEEVSLKKLCSRPFTPVVMLYNCCYCLYNLRGSLGPM